MSKDEKTARRKWICGTDFTERPLNESGLPRVELIRRKDDQVQFLAIKVPGENKFQSTEDCCKTFSGDTIEVKIIEVI